MALFFHSAYFLEFVEAVSSGIIILNVRGEAYVVNAAAARILGRRKEDILDAGWRTMLGQVTEEAELARFVEDILQPDRNAMPLQVRFQQPGGQTLHLSLSSSILKEYEKVFGILLLLVDVTPLVLMHEQENRLLRDQAALQRERIASLDHLANAVAHQIRNPLMTIGGFAVRLRRKAENPQTAYLDAILDSCGRLERIVKAVGEYASIRAPGREPTPALDLVMDALRLAGQSETQGENLASDATPGAQAGPLPSDQAPALTRDARHALDLAPGLVLANRPLAARMLAEVLKNARRAASGTPGSVRVTGAPADTVYRFTIADDGPGFAADILPFVFDPFFTTDPQAVGMGLCIAQRVVHEHGGGLTVGDGPSGGARVEIELPLA